MQWPFARRQPKDSQTFRAELLWKQGQRLLERKRYDRAIAAMRQAMELEPSRFDGA